MDYSKLNLPKLNLGGLIIAIALGTVVAIALYQVQVRGLIPNLSLPKVPVSENRTIIQEENAVISAVEKTSSSIVAIGVTRKGIIDSTIGTGFVVSEGLIVTNKHVVSENGTYTVVTKDGQKYEVRKIYRDPNFDLAIVQIDKNNLKALEFGDSSKLKVGQTVIAIGNALGKFTNTVTVGVVSGLGRRVVAGDIFEGSVESLDDLIQTDAAINPGNSGGPLLNSSGQVIGMNVATTEGAQNIGFAIPGSIVKKIVSEFGVKGFVSRPYLGIRYKFISNQGAYVQEVIDGSPAQKAGVIAGDIITKINSDAIDSESKLADIVSKGNIGQNMELTVLRDGKQLSVKVALAESPNQ